MRRLAVIMLTLSLVTLPGLLLQPVLVLRVTTGHGTSVICARSRAGTMIGIEYTHSMYGGFVRETYRLTQHATLIRQQFLTENAAAAEYYGTDGQTMRVATGYEVLAPPFTTDELVIRVDQRGDHWLTVGDSRYHLAQLLPGSTQVHIAGERTSAWRASCP